MMQSRVDRVGDILRSGIQYVVPSYQRAYAWRKDQWEMLWQGVLETIDLSREREHFLARLCPFAFGADSPKVVFNLG